MKKLYYISALIIMSILLMSNRGGRGSAAGPNGAVTGAPGENGGSCGQGGCHSAGNFNPSVDLFLIDQDGIAVEKYVPGESYTVSLKINHTGLPDGYGFQMVCLEDTGETTTGSFNNLPQNINIIPILDRDYVEQSNILPVDSIPLPWIAPEAGTGDITFYAIANVVNGAQGPGGDGVNNGSFSFEEAVGSSVDQLENSRFEIYPNPVSDILTITGPATKDTQIEILDLYGNRVHVGESTSIDVSHLSAGTYFVKVNDSYKCLNTKRLIKI